MVQCARCGEESDDLRILRSRSNGPGRKGEAVCAFCLAEAHDNGGLTAEEIAQEDARWDRIFARFVDPDYYRTPAPILQSSFRAFSSQMEILYGSPVPRVVPVKNTRAIRKTEKVSTQVLIDALRNFYAVNRRIPKRRDIGTGGTPGWPTYWRRFGSLGNALDAAGLGASSQMETLCR
jgi:hypothetical protein